MQGHEASSWRRSLNRHCQVSSSSSARNASCRTSSGEIRIPCSFSACRRTRATNSASSSAWTSKPQSHVSTLSMHHLEGEARKGTQDAGKLPARRGLDPFDSQGLARGACLDRKRGGPDRRASPARAAGSNCLCLSRDRTRPVGAPRRAGGSALGADAAGDLGEGSGGDSEQAPGLARRMRGRRSEGPDSCLRVLPARAAGRKLGRFRGGGARSGRGRGSACGRRLGKSQGGGKNGRIASPTTASPGRGWSLGRGKAPPACRCARAFALLPRGRLPELGRPCRGGKVGAGGNRARTVPGERLPASHAKRMPPPATAQRHSEPTNDADGSSTRNSAPTLRPRPSRSTANS